MPKPDFIFLWLSLLVFSAQLQFGQAEIGTASHYSSPYTPTECFGNDPGQFPPNYYFAAAGEGIWDNGAACGRQYFVQCISSAVCGNKMGIIVRIVDRAQTSVSRPAGDGTLLVLSDVAYAAVADTKVATINIQFQQLT